MGFRPPGVREDIGPVIPHSAPAAERRPLEAARSGPAGLKRFLKVLGPGFISGASNDDPAAIGTFTVAGASFGLATLWTVPITLPMMAAVQYTCSKIAMVSGRGLTGVLRRHYPRWLLYPVAFALLIANTISVGADIGAIAAGINVVVPIPIAALIVPVTLGILALQIWGSYRLLANVFKWLALALLAYAGSALFSRPDAREVLRHTFVPTVELDRAFLMTLVAILGTRISPYLFFWQASQEVEEEVEKGRHTIRQRRGASDDELQGAAIDTNVGMFFCQVVVYFIILATGTTLFEAGQRDVSSAAEAAEALRPLAGDAAGILLALGLVGAGVLAVPILSGSAAYALSEAFGWSYGLSTAPGRAKQFYAVIAASTLVGMLINFSGINPIQALLWASVLNGLLAPPVLALIMLAANNRAVMGERVNTPVTNVIGWATVAVLFAAVFALVLMWL